MKRLYIIVLTFGIFFPQLSFALPDGAVARLGKGTVNAVTFSPDGTMLAVANSYGVYLYDANTLEEIDFFETNKKMTSVAFNFDSSLLASGSVDNTIKLCCTYFSQAIVKAFKSIWLHQNQ
jgi:WD40 repeat protein